jgi:hypothetical protein
VFIYLQKKIKTRKKLNIADIMQTKI